MFERYTEKARRVIFFARYEASQYGSPTIETEHLLLGLLREDRKLILLLLPKTNGDLVRQQIDAHTEKRPFIATSVDLPLSEESKEALHAAVDEADRFNHRHIGTEHLLLGLLRQKSSFAAKILRENGADLEGLRSNVEKLPGQLPPRVVHPSLTLRPPAQPTVEIHGAQRDSRPIRKELRRCHEHTWHWHKQAWTPRDIVIDHKTGRISFDVALATDTAKFTLVKGGWTRDHCAVCRWELFESKDDATHGMGYTNGRDWICVECYEKFFQGPDFFGSAYADMT